VAEDLRKGFAAELSGSMAKRKHEQIPDGQADAKRTKNVVEKIKQKEEEIVATKETSVSEPAATQATSVRIVTGSYEKVLCGIDARFPSNETV
jgi:hypothetical protein